MSQPRRKCRLSDAQHRDVDLRQFAQLIVDTVNQTVSGKHPRVYRDHFSTDPLTQSEAVALGRALSKLSELKCYGKTVTVFRLFNGKTDSDDEVIHKSKSKGGRVK